MSPRSDRIAAIGGVAAVALLALGVVAGLLRVLAPSVVTGLESAIPPALLVAIAAGALALLAVALLRDPFDHRHGEPLVTGQPPEQPRDPPALVGDGFNTAVTNAARAVRVQQADPTTTEPYQRLHETAVSVLSTARNCSQTAAETRIDVGEWTTDPVASAFFSPTVTAPLWFRLFRWARPALAYERAVSRTVTEIRAIAAADVPGYAARAEQTVGERPAEPTTSPGLLGSLRRLLAGVSASAPADDPRAGATAMPAPAPAEETDPPDAVAGHDDGPAKTAPGGGADTAAEPDASRSDPSVSTVDDVSPAPDRESDAASTEARQQ